MPPHTDLNKPKLRMTGAGTVGNAGTTEEKRTAIWDHLNAAYDASLANGTRYWNNLSEKVEAYADDRDALIARLTLVRADYDRRYNAHYVTSVSDEGHTRTSGHLERTAESRADLGHYDNTIDTTTGSISADWNYANRDPARLSDAAHRGEDDYVKKGLPNSEILWRQYFEASKKRFWVFKERRAKAAMTGLNRLKRHNVLNTTTLQAGYMALPNAHSYDTAHEWEPADDDFKAVLGTPNCSGAAFMLADHIDEIGGKTIGRIRATGEGDAQLNNVNLDIEFEEIPEAEEIAEAEVELEAGEEAADEIEMTVFSGEDSSSEEA